MPFAFEKASYFCVHVINFDLIIMKYKFIFEVILILRLYLSRMRRKKKIEFQKEDFILKI